MTYHLNRFTWMLGCFFFYQNWFKRFKKKNRCFYIFYEGLIWKGEIGKMISKKGGCNWKSYEHTSFYFLLLWLSSLRTSWVFKLFKLCLARDEKSKIKNSNLFFINILKILISYPLVQCFSTFFVQRHTNNFWNHLRHTWI